MIPALNLRDGIHIPAETVKGFLWGGVESGMRWMHELPTILDAVCEMHSITRLWASPELRMNLVLFGESDTHGAIVLKLAQPHQEVDNEITSMRIHSGSGRYAELIDTDNTAAW